MQARTDDLVVFGNHQNDRHAHRDITNNIFLGQCPYPGCGLAYPDIHTLFEHCDGLHPLSIYQPENAKPYKCPFCAKRYAKERYMQAHQNSSHRPNRWAPTFNYGPNLDQEALFRVSRQSTIGNATQAACGASEPDVRNDQSFSESGASPNWKESYNRSLQVEDEEAYSIVTRDGRTYIDTRLLLRSPQSDDLGTSDAGGSPRPQITVQSSERTAIGHFRRPQSTDRTMTDAEDDDDEYPEAFALDEDELPRRNLWKKNL